MQKTVLSFGETLWDLYPSGPVLGGAPFNFACRIHSLGDRGIIVTRVGRDELGSKALERIAELGMEVSCVQKDDQRPTATVQVMLDASGNPDFVVAPEVASDCIDLTYELLELAATADCFCFGTLAQRTESSRRTLHRLLEVATKGVKCLDINLRKNCYFEETITYSIEKADILKMNLHEAHYLADLFEVSISSLPDFCAEIMEEWSLACCLVTLGEHGAFAATRAEKVYAPGYEVSVVDTCGAGDAFSAAFVHEYLRGKSLSDCCRLGNALGAIVATQKGATTPVGIEEVHQFLNAKRRRVHESSLKPFEVV